MHILHVDDEPLILELTQIYLERDREMKITTCRSAEEALDLVNIEEFDAIISDYEMPGMNGIDLLFDLRSAGMTTPFIIFTGRGREDVVIEALNTGADFYIQKGGEARSQFAELKNAVRRAVEKSRVEQNIRESERRISDIFHHLPDATFAIDCAGRVIAWNRAMETMTGVAAGEIIGTGGHTYARPFYGVSRPSLVDCLLHPTEEVPSSYMLNKREQGLIIAETKEASLNGEPVVLWAKATLLYDKHGNVAGVIESVRDITAQKQAEKELQSAGEYRRTLIEAHIDPLVTIGPDRRIGDVNAATETLTGMTRDALIGADFCSLFTDPGRAEEAYQKVLAEGTVRDHALGVRDGDGNMRPVLFYGTVYRGGDGETRGVFAELHDILPSMNEKGLLHTGTDEETRKIVSLHLDIISHDLSNTISATLGYADLLDGMLEGEAGEIAEKMVRTLRKSQEVIRNLDTRRKIDETRRDTTILQEISLDAVIRNEISHFPGIKIDYEGCEGRVGADRLVGEIFWNLFDNSVRYGGKGVSIRVDVRDDGDRVEVMVEDTGPGISGEIRKALSSDVHGHGLCIVRDLIACYGGEMSIGERLPGRPEEGTRVRIVLRKPGERQKSAVHSGRAMPVFARGM